jgi:preprotein translocase subunit SecG
MSSIETFINWIIILLGIVLVVVIFVIPKNDCDVCSFNGLNGKGFFEDYSKQCLQKYSMFEENPNLEKLDLENIGEFSALP